MNLLSRYSIEWLLTIEWQDGEISSVCEKVFGSTNTESVHMFSAIGTQFYLVI